MRTKVQKWGNSLAVRIPQAFAVEAGLERDSAVEVSVVGEKVVIERAEGTLADLLAAITEENRHGEVETGPAVGNEAW